MKMTRLLFDNDSCQFVTIDNRKAWSSKKYTMSKTITKELEVFCELIDTN